MQFRPQEFNDGLWSNKHLHLIPFLCLIIVMFLVGSVKFEVSVVDENLSVDMTKFIGGLIVNSDVITSSELSIKN